jgi:hypothetical protein
MANWTPGGFVGKTFQITAAHVPPPPDVPPPVLWGDEAAVEQRFSSRASVQTTRREFLFEFPFGPEEVVEFFRTCFGPIQVAFSRLDPAGQEALAADLVHVWREHNQGAPGQTSVRTEFLEVLARPN